MSLLILALGFIIVNAAIIDLLYTVLEPNGSGFISGRYTFLLWRGALRLAGNNGKSWFLTRVGVIILYLIVLLWVMMIWLGNTLIVYSDPFALINEHGTAFKTDFISKLYFSGYVLSAMGHGDYSPATDFWKTYTAFISFTGVILLSLSISYLIPVVQAVTAKRELSLRIANLGRSPEHILNRHWKKDKFKTFIAEVNDMKGSIFNLAQKHLAYPVVHYFHSVHRVECMPISLAMLDETLTIMISALEDKFQEEELGELEETRQSITYFLGVLEKGHISPEMDEPETPDLSYLKDLDVPMNYNMDEVNEAFSGFRERRKLLLAYVQNDGWKWKDVTTENEPFSLGSG